jgi:uncharacterized Zn finger protein
MKTIADLTDEFSLMKIAGAPTYLEGATCAEHHCVELLDSDDENVTARVVAMDTYDTTLSLDDGRLAWTCTCGQATAEQPCPHVVAVGVTVWRESPARPDHPDDLNHGRGIGLPGDEE